MPRNSTLSAPGSTVFQPMCGSTGALSWGDGPRPFAEALGVVAALDAVLEQHLHPDADPEHGATAGQTTIDDLVSAMGAQGITHGLERTDTGHDETVGLESGGAVACQHGIRTGGHERLDRRMDVARLVVEDRDARCCAHSAPLVEGTPSTRGSSALA